MRTFDGVEEFAGQLGQRLGESDWRLITQADIDLFAEVTGDDQWIHVDPERAAAGPYGATIAHGYLTVSLIPVLVWGIYRIEGLSSLVNYGSDRVRFPHPVRVDSRVRAVAELIDVTPGGGGWLATIRTTIEIEGSTKPACVAETISLLVP